MADVLTYKVSAAPVVDADVVERQMILVLNDDHAAPVLRLFTREQTDLGTIDVPQDAKVLLTLVDVDDAGNRSEPAVLEFVATDTLPPAQPGGLGVALVAEKAAEDVTPEVTPEVAPAPEPEADA